jgi:two-component system sensor histidine kinase DesK
VREWLGNFGWATPWLLFLYFPVADLVATDRPGWQVALGALALVLFVAAYAMAWAGLPGSEPEAALAHGDVVCRRAVLALAVLSVVLPVVFGVSWGGLVIYVATAAAMAHPPRRAWVITGTCAGLVLGILVAHGSDGLSLFFLPLIAVMSGFAMQGTRHLITVNAELTAAREELARNAVAEERLRFARDLHDLLGHSLSLIALKSELARRLAPVDGARAATEMADVEAAARRALAEVREAVSGYRQVSCAQAVAEARAALSGAGIAFRGPDRVPVLPGPVDAALGWVVREATTNVLRHSAARTVTVGLVEDGVSAALTVTDDGRGPAEDTAPGSGLTGLRERVTAVDGTLTGGAAPGGGYRLRAELPLVPTAVAL